MIEIVHFRKFEKNTLQGFLEVKLPTSGIIVRDIAVHWKNDNRWLSMPSRSYQKQDGETAFVPLVAFSDKKRWYRFQNLTFAALDEYISKQQPPEPEKLETETIQREDDIPF
jgi:hypothetical protein